MSNTTGYVSNPELASRLSKLVDRWNTRENQMIALLTQEEGTVVVTDGLGINHTLPSFPQLQKDVTALTDDLTGAVSTARDLVSVATAMATASGEYADDAQASAEASEASAVRAAETVASIDTDVQAIADSAAAAAAKAAEAADSATRADLSATAAAHAAGDASTYAGAASVVADAAAASATEAGIARSGAQAAANAATAARDQAQALLDQVTDTADLAEADATAAASAAAAAANSATAASTSAAAATTQANRAEAQAATAATKAGEAAGAATTAAGHASTASGYASAASTAAQTASTAKAAAEAARDAANLYANAPQGTEVAPGEFSAKHWATQAQAAATGALVYMGSWDASTGVFPPAPAKGHFYKVVGAGTVGGIEWGVGDQALYGVEWEKIDNTDQVTSVAGKQGAVSLVAGDIGGLGSLATRSDVDFNTHVTGKPLTYPPSAHSHTKAEVGLDKVDNTADLDKPVSAAVQAALDGKADSAHSHAVTDVSGLQDALDGKAAATHSHTVASVSGLQAALDGKAASSHGHSVDDVGGLRSVLEWKVNSIAAAGSDISVRTPSGFYEQGSTGTGWPSAGSNWWHLISSTHNNPSNYYALQLACPFESEQLYFRSTRNNGRATWRRVWHEGDFNPANKADVTHAHTIANVSGLQGALDAKASVSNALFTGPINVSGASDLSIQLNPTGGRSVRFAATSSPNTGFWDVTNSVWLLRIGADNSANFVGNVNAQSVTAAGELYCNNWLRSNVSGYGWYHQVHGGGWHMTDNLWIRAYNKRGVLIAGSDSSNSGLRLEGTSPTITLHDTDAGTTHWIHCNDNNLGFLAANSFGWACFRNASNEWQCQSNVIAYASDARLKENVADIERRKVDDFFSKFRVREYDWSDEKIAELNPGFTYSAKHEYGAIAQEVEGVLPYMVHESAHNGIKTILWDKAVPLLIAEVQELRKRVAELEGGA